MNHFPGALKFGMIVLLCFMLSTVGCAKKIIVEIPPRIDLGSFQTIGIVAFTSNSTEALNQFVTQKMMSYIQGGQPMVRFLELGSQEKLLREVGRSDLDFKTVKAIGKKYQVDSIFTGTYEVSELKPKVSLSEDLSSINASANVHITMASKHWDTRTGATIWTKSRYGEWPVGKVSAKKGNPFSFSMSDPEEKYGHFLSKLAYAVTDDFRPHYEKRKVPK